MKHLKQRQVENTGIIELKNSYKKVRNVLAITIFILMCIVSLLFLTFIKNDILGDKWLYIDKETLD